MTCLQEWLIVKCEAHAQGINRRMVVTNRRGARTCPAGAYDDYADRGESENRNKELKCELLGDRLSDHRYLANCFRLFLHALAVNLLVRLRRLVATPPPHQPLGFETLDHAQWSIIVPFDTVSLRRRYLHSGNKNLALYQNLRKVRSCSQVQIVLGPQLLKMNVQHDDDPKSSSRLDGEAASRVNLGSNLLSSRQSSRVSQCGMVPKDVVRGDGSDHAIGDHQFGRLVAGPVGKRKPLATVIGDFEKVLYERDILRLIGQAVPDRLIDVVDQRHHQ